MENRMEMELADPVVAYRYADPLATETTEQRADRMARWIRERKAYATRLAAQYADLEAWHNSPDAPESEAPFRLHQMAYYRAEGKRAHLLIQDARDAALQWVSSADLGAALERLAR